MTQQFVSIFRAATRMCFPCSGSSLVFNK